MERQHMRECEKSLYKYGIACFPSGAKWVDTWVNKAIRLKERAENELIIQNGLITLISGLNEITKDKLLSDDELDAILSAYTAYLEEKGSAVKIDGADGVIYIPTKSMV